MLQYKIGKYGRYSLREVVNIFHCLVEIATVRPKFRLYALFQTVHGTCNDIAVLSLIFGSVPVKV
jgi:hypothetical protein